MCWRTLTGTSQSIGGRGAVGQFLVTNAALKLKLSPSIGTIHLCHVCGGKREATNSDALFPGAKLLQTFTLVRDWVVDCPTHLTLIY